MNRAQYLACEKQLLTVAALVRELPLRAFLDDAGPPQDPSSKKIAEALLGLQAVLPPPPAHVFRGSK